MEIKNLLFQQLARIRVAEKHQELESRGVAGVVDRAAGEKAVVGASSRVATGRGPVNWKQVQTVL